MKQIVDTVGEYYKIKIPTIPTIIVYPLAYLFGLLKIIGLHVPIYPSRLNNIRATYCYDIQKSLDIGYKPIYNLSQGIKETLDWYEEKRLI